MSAQPVARAPVRTAPGIAIAWMLATMALFVSLDTLAKFLMQTYPVAQVVWARYVFHVLLMAILLAPRSRGLLRTRRLGLQLVRSVFLLGATGFFFTAISFMPLATASAIMFVAPILVTGLSLPLLGEPVGPHRWASVIVGFMGALLIVRPSAAGMDPAAIFALGAAGSYALYQITTRKLSGVDPPLTTLAYSAVVGAIATSLWVPTAWVTPAPAHWFALAGLGLLGGAGHFTLIKAFENASAATVAPFSYSSLIWATLFGYAIFGDLPDRRTVLGALVIMGSGLYILHRERVRRERDVNPPRG